MITLDVRCPRCNGPVQRDTGFDRLDCQTCIVCGWEDYQHATMPTPRGPEYRLAYVGDKPALVNRITTLRVCPEQRNAAWLRPLLVGSCPFELCDATLRWNRSRKKPSYWNKVGEFYECDNRHHIVIVSDNKGELVGWL